MSYQDDLGHGSSMSQAVPEVRAARVDWWNLSDEARDEIVDYLDKKIDLTACCRVAKEYLRRHHGVNS